jgi:flagellar biogenesis protein FliO
VTVFIITIFLTAGCEEQQAANPKQSRLIVAEKDAEIASLKKALENCEVEKAKIKNDTDKDLDSLGTDSMETFEKNIKLQEENENLKKQIEELTKKTGQNK